MARQSGSRPLTRASLPLIKAVLVLVALGLCLVGRRVGGWPIVGWPMYSARWPEVPAATISTIELRVVSPGETIRVAAGDLYPFERIPILEEMFEHAFDLAATPHRAADRAYLAGLLRRRLRDAGGETIEGWRLEWNVDPLAVPPLDRDRPIRELRLGWFPAATSP